MYTPEIKAHPPYKRIVMMFLIAVVGVFGLYELSKHIARSVNTPTAPKAISEIQDQIYPYGVAVIKEICLNKVKYLVITQADLSHTAMLALYIDPVTLGPIRCTD